MYIKLISKILLKNLSALLTSISAFRTIPGALETMPFSGRDVVIEWSDFALIEWSDFDKVDIRAGRIIDVKEFPEARNPSYRIKVDLGEELGVRKSCAQLTNYPRESLLGKQVICVVNFPPKQIGPAVSEVLILGLPTEENGIALLVPDYEAELGSRVF